MKLKENFWHAIYCLDPTKKRPEQLVLMANFYLSVSLGFLSVSIAFYSTARVPAAFFFGISLAGFFMLRKVYGKTMAKVGK